MGSFWTNFVDLVENNGNFVEIFHYRKRTVVSDTATVKDYSNKCSEVVCCVWVGFDEIRKKPKPETNAIMIMAFDDNFNFFPESCEQYFPVSSIYNVIKLRCASVIL